MKKLFLILFLIASISFAKEFNTDVLQIGKSGSSTDAKFQVLDGSNTPFLKFDKTTKKWLQSEDGTIEKAFGSGAASASGGIQFLLNPSFEEGLGNWTNSGGTLTQETHTNTREGNESFARFVSTIAGEYFESDAITISDDVGPGCMADFKYMQGDNAFDYKVLKSPYADPADVVSEGSVSDLTLFLKAPTVTFDCAGGDLFKLRIVSTGAGTIDADEAYLGSNKNITPVGKMSHFVGKASWAFATNFQWDVTGAAWSSFPADGDATTPTVSGDITVTDNQKPVITIANAKKGFYKITLNGFIVAASSDTGVRILSSESEIAAASFIDTTGNNFTSISGTIEVLADGSVDFEIQGYNAVSMKINTVSRDPLTIGVEYFPSGSETTEAWTPEQADFFIDVNIGGANINSVNTTTPTELVNATLDMVLNKGSAKIPCSTTNTSTGLTCSAGSEGVGVVFNAPVAGKYKVCGSWMSGWTSSGAHRWVETIDGSQAVLQTANSLGGGTSMTAAASNGERVCGFFDFSSVGEKVIRLFGTGNNVEVVIDADRHVNLYSRDINITIELVSHNVPRPIIQNMVDTSVGSGTREDTCKISNSGTPTIDATSGLCESWISSLTDDATGVTTLNLVTGQYSADPVCEISIAQATQAFDNVVVSSPTAVTVRTFVIAGTAADLDFNIKCTGKR